MGVPFYNPDTDTQAPAPRISFDTVGNNPPDPQIADERARKYDFALGEKSPGEDAIRNTISSGTDQPLRQAVAAQKDLEDSNHRLAIVQAIGQMRQGPVSPEEMDVIRGLKPDPKGRNVQTILEQEYANMFMNFVTTATSMMTTTLGAVANQSEDHLFKMTDLTAGVKTKQETTLRVLQDYENKYAKSSTVGAIGNAALELIPGFTTWSTSRMLPELPGTFFPGSSLSQKLQSLHLMNPEDYEKTLTKAAADLYDKNPVEAMRFLRAVHQYTTSDKGIGDAFAALDIAGIASFFSPSKVAAPAAALGRFMTKDELLAAKIGSAIEVGKDRAARTVRTPRAMEADELIRANINPPGPSSFTPDAIKAMGERLKQNAIAEAEMPRLMTIRELDKARISTEGGRLMTAEEIDAVKNRLVAAEAYKSILKAGSDPVVNVAKILAGSGQVDQSAVLQAAQEAAGNLQGKQGIKDFGERVQSFLNPVRMDNATALSAEATKRIALGLTENAKTLAAAIMDPVRVRRLPDVALIAGLRETVAKAKDFYSHVNDTIMDIRWNLGRAPEDIGNFPKGQTVTTTGNVSNTNSVDLILGRKDATPFATEANARYTATLQYKLGKQGFEVEQFGGGWVIKVNKPVDETTKTVRDLLVQTETQTPQTLWNMFIGRFRSSQDVTSRLNSESRVLVTHGSQAMQAIMKEVASDIGKLSRDEYKNMKRFFELDRDWHGPDKVPGRFLDTASQFEAEYLNVFKRLPSEKETAAYFGYRQLNDFDYLTRNLGLYRDLHRLGVENVRFKFMDKEGAKKLSEYFMARERDTLPLQPTSPNAGVYVFDSTTGKGKTYRTAKFDAKQIAEVNRKIKEDGYKVYEIADPLSRPLREIAGVNDYVNFVVVRDASTRGLDYDLIPYKAGGHREYATSWFAKQANIARLGGRFNYEGDKTLLGQYSQAEATKYVAALNKARELYVTKSKDFDSFVSGNLPADWGPKELRAKFASREFDPNEPFHVTYTGQTVKDVDAQGLAARYGDKLHDEANSPYNLMQQVDKKFTGARDPALKTIKENGSELSPLYNLEDAPLIDPLKSLNRTVSNVVHQRLISDYKWQSVETFVAEFGKFMDIPQETLRQNPLYWLANPKWKSTPDSVGLATAKAQRDAIAAFMSMDSPDVRAFKWLQHKMLDGVFTGLGQGTSDYVAEHLLATVSDPFKYARNVAFHSKMGLFNPVQLLNQLQTLTHITALAGPVNASKAVVGAALMTMLRATENPKIIAHFDDIASKLGWKPGQLTHAYDQMRRSGWHLVQGETSWRNDVADPDIITSTWGKVLNAGAVFFTEGERFTRTAAWAASYLEHTNGLRASQWNDQVLQKTLSRADLMNVNMTRASMSPLQQGAAGVTTQFLGYQARLFEQMWGSRLTTAEKARVLATYSAMYGIPATSGIAVGLWPMYDSMRNSALERNPDGDGSAWDNSATKVLMEGLPSILIKLATGKDTNYAERFGPQGITSLSDLLSGDKKWWEILGGVSASTIKDIGTALHPLFTSAMSAVIGKNDQFPFLVEDVTDAAKTITTFNNTFKAIYAWNYLKYLTKDGSPIADADKMDAILTGAFGLTRRDIADTFRMIKSMKALKDSQDAMAKEVVREMRRAYEAATNDDSEMASSHIMRAQHFFRMGDFKPEQMQEINKQASRGFEDMANKVRWDFFMRKAPQSQVKQRMKALGVEGEQ